MTFKYFEKKEKKKIDSQEETAIDYQLNRVFFLWFTFVGKLNHFT